MSTDEPQAPLSERKLVTTNIYEARGRYYLRIQAWNEREDAREYIRTWVACAPGLTLQDAQSLLKRVQRDLEAGRFLAARYKNFRVNPTLQDAFDDTLEQRILGGIKPNTVTHWKLNGRKFLPTLGALPVAEIDYFDVREWWATWQAEAPSANTANQALKVLRAVFAHAIRAGWRPAGANPASAISTKMLPHKPRPRPITAEDWGRISDWLSAHDRKRCVSGDRKATRARDVYMGHWAYAVTQVSLAARGAEVCGLEWSDIHWEQHTVNLRNTKTAPSLIRPVAPELLRLLQYHGDLMRQYSPPAMHKSPYIFPGLDGKRTIPNNRFRRVWRQCLDALGMPNGRKNNGWTPHDLRRWGIALLYETGASTRDVMEFVGHATAEAHQRYLRAEPTHLRLLAESVSSSAILDAEVLAKSKGPKSNETQ